jgi:hypothetical protein
MYFLFGMKTTDDVCPIGKRARKTKVTYANPPEKVPKNQ